MGLLQYLSNSPRNIALAPDFLKRNKARHWVTTALASTFLCSSLSVAEPAAVTPPESLLGRSASREVSRETQSQTFVQRFLGESSREGIAAIVEGKVITFEDIRRELRPLLPQLQSQYPNRQALDQAVLDLAKDIRQVLVERVLVKTEFEKLGFRIPATYIDGRIDELLVTEFEGDRQRRHEYLQKRNQTFQEYREELEEKIIIDAMRARLERSQAMVSPVRIQNYYDNHKDDFYEEEQVKLITIMLLPEAGQEVADVVKKAEQIRSQALEGTSFEELAKNHGQDPIGGKPGQERWYSRSDLRAPMSDVAFALENGSVSEPVVIDPYVFLFKLTERKPRGIRELNDVRDEIEQILVNQSTRQAMQEWVQALLSRSYVRFFDF